jgi:hypothetical protein
MTGGIIKVKMALRKGFDESTEQEKDYLQVKVTDSGPVFTRDEQFIILKPLTSFRQAPMDKCNISNLRKITKAINAKIFVTSGKEGKTNFVL